MRTRVPEEPFAAETSPQDREISELDGFIDLGLKKEALALARSHLKRRPKPDLFFACLNAILTLADNAPRWRGLVEAAYADLSLRGRRKVRFLMLSFYYSMGDYEAAYAFIPRRFGGAVGPVDVSFAVETLLSLGKMDEAGHVVCRAVKMVPSMEDPDGRAMLMNCIVTYLSEVGEWDRAIPFWETLQDDRLMAESAIFGLIGAHLRRAVKAIASGRAALERLRKDPDPHLETCIPGNDARRWRRAEKTLKRVERHGLLALSAIE